MLLSGALPMAGGVRAAHADELSDAKATLDAASKELDALTSEYRSLETELASLDEQVSEATDKGAKAQQAMIEGQEDLGDTVVAQYKSDDSLSFTAICLNSADLSDLVKNRRSCATTSSPPFPTSTRSAIASKICSIRRKRRRNAPKRSFPKPPPKSPPSSRSVSAWPT